MTRFRLVAVALLVMVAAIGGAWAFELIGGYVPCALCLTQRLGYYAAIPLTLVALVVPVPLLPRLLLLAAAGAMAWSAGIGAYQAGAEWGFWEGPSACGGGVEVRDAADLMAAMRQTRLVSCTEAAGRILGISFAGWNAIAAGFSAALLALSAFVRR